MVRRPGAEPEQRYFDSVYQPVRDEAGRVAGVLIFATDVTDHVRDRQQLEELADRLQRSEERYRTLFETLPHGIIRFERDGSPIGANPAAEEILGLPSDHTVADRARHTLHEDGTPYQPDDLPMMVALRTGKVVPGVVAAVDNARTGEIRWIRITAVPDAWDAQGKPRRAYSVFTDITEQRRAQAGLRESNRLLGRLRDANVLGVLWPTRSASWRPTTPSSTSSVTPARTLRPGASPGTRSCPPSGRRVREEAVEQMRRTGAALAV